MLTHLDKNGNATMVDINNKNFSNRQAIAVGEILITQDILDSIKKQSLKKGDIFTVAKLAGINAAKKTSELIPLCHQLPLDLVDVKFEIDEKKLLIRSTALIKTSYKTGVEMEALIAVNISLLTIYDMCKGLSKKMQINNIYLQKKTGGKSGEWNY